MHKILFILLFSHIALSVSAEAGPLVRQPGRELIKVLILSGKNNHEWQKTTPVLTRIFKETMLFSVSVTENPDTLSYRD